LGRHGFANLRSFMMKKLSVLLGTFLSCCVIGCSADPKDELVAKTIAGLKQATTDIEHVSDTLTSATADAKKSGKPLAIAKVATATEQAGEIKKIAMFLQTKKAETEVYKDQMTKEQREALNTKYKADFQRAMADLDTAERKLDAALKDAEVVADGDGKQALEKLREKLKEGQDEFEVLTKRQT
jgi:hypothetical protein